MKTVAIIPARGGSTGLPGKNIRLLNGIPLVGRTVLAATGAAHISKVYVSSDTPQILSVAEKFGAIGIERPAELSTSTASSESVLVHVLEILERSDGSLPDIIVFLQCTSPFTTSAHIDAVVKQLLTQDASAAFAAVEDHGFIWQVTADGSAAGVTHNHTQPRSRRQDMKPRYRETGAIYAMRVPDFLASGNRFCGRTVLVPVEMPPIEIDTQQDWEIAEAFARFEGRANVSVLLGRSVKALVTDFDGVHTDNLVTIDEDGREQVTCSRGDGMGIEQMKVRGLHLLIISREKNSVVEARAAKLGMGVLHHIQDKLPALDLWRRQRQLEWSEIAYVGNDVNDLECMKACGLSFAPADAYPIVRDAATVVLKSLGGRGALREVSDMLLYDEAKG